jgi:uncharacterized membrane protein/mono/diheme cytochrome c family protein
MLAATALESIVTADVQGAGSDVLDFLARLHVVVVHAPIGLLVGAGLIELLRRAPRDARPAESAVWCLGLGAASAVLAAWLGALAGERIALGGEAGRLLILHRWSGLATALVSAATFAASRAARRGAWVAGYRLGLAASAALVVVSLHLGATIVWGQGFVLRALDSESPAAALPGALDEPLAALEPAAPIATEPSATQPASTPIDPAPAPPAAFLALPDEVDFELHVRPLLEARCLECHGPKKKKGGIRFDQPRTLFRGDPADWPVQPGNSSASLLIELVRKPADSDERMPSKGDPLGQAEIALLARWIDQGAKYPGGPPTPEEARAAAGVVIDAADEAPAELAEPPDAETLAAEERAIAALRALGGHAGRIAQDSWDVEVNLSFAGRALGDEELAALTGLERALVALDLSRTGVTDVGVARLAGFERLETLRLASTDVGDGALAALAAHRALEMLNLYDTRVTDAGLEALASMSGLERVYLTGAAVSQAGLERLRASRSELLVVHVLPTEPATPSPEPELVAACCEAARAAGGACAHPCCVDAASRGAICPSCARPSGGAR